MNKVKYLLGPMRLPFLILTPACVFEGFGTALWKTGHVNLFYFLLALIGGLAAHISVNAFNEYFDFKSGLDFRTQRTPFSGGSGTLPQRPELAKHALALAILAAVIDLLIGLYFLWVRGWGIVPLGLLGLIVVVAYTPWITRSPLVCLIAPGLGFGTLMVMGTHFVLTGEYSWAAFWASLVPFFLVSDLLLLNQFPDVEADRTAGRLHYPMVLGRKKSSVIYAAFLFLAYASLVMAVVLGELPWLSLLGLLTIPIALQTASGVRKYAEDLEHLMPYLAKNVLINISTPSLMAIGLILAHFV